MIENLGYTIKEIRKDKKIPIKSICTDVMDPGNYWRLESGQIESYFSNVVHLIDRLNVSYQEFMFILNERMVTDTINYNEKFFRAWSHQSIEKIEELKNEVIEKYEETGDFKAKMRIAICTLYINRIKNENYDKKSTQTLSNYLFKIENWHYYELCLLINTLFIYDTESVFLLYQKAFKGMKRFEDIQETGNEGMILTVNTIYQCIRNDRKDYVIELVQHLDQIKLNRFTTYGRAIRKWVKCICDAYLLDDLEQIEESRKYVDIFKILDMDDNYLIYNEWTNHIKKLLSERKNSCVSDK
jgi:Rgg/GadR/MutR family transcriptional activator